MTRKDVHFEIFRRRDPKDAWTMHDASSVREKALAMATDLLSAEKGMSVRVVKESYDTESGDHFSLTIFEEGHTRLKLEPQAEDAPPVLPCFKPEDLYSQHARATLTRLLRDFLTHHKITVSELIHRADSLAKLEMAGTVFQHAVQKVAVAQSSTSNASVQQIVKALNELASKAIARVQRDTKRSYFPKVKPGSFGALAAKLADELDGAYIFGGALARHLSASTDWDAKLRTLLTLMPEAPQTGAGRTLFMGAVDAVTAEIVANSTALRALIGESDNLGEALSALVWLFLGMPTASESDSLRALAELFGADELPLARRTVANRIIAELKSGHRLCPASRVEELQLLRNVANKLAIADPRYLSHDSLIAALTLRSRRLVSNEAIGEYIAGLAPDERVERLLAVEKDIVGASNKKQLAAVLQQTLRSQEFADHFLTGAAPAMGRLRRLADLQARAQRSDIREELRQEFADCLDRIAIEIENRGKVFKMLEENMPEPAERAMAVLKLCTGNALTEGRVRDKARDLVMSALAEPGFLRGYVAQLKDGEAPEQAMRELAELLELAGISREVGLKAIAA